MVGKMDFQMFYFFLPQTRIPRAYFVSDERKCFKFLNLGVKISGLE